MLAKITRSKNTRDATQRSFLTLVLCALLFASGCDKPLVAPKVDLGKTPAQTVNVVRVAQTDKYNQVATYYGNLQPSQRAQLGFGSPGKVTLVSKTAGQKVKAGEIIAQYDIARLENDRKQVASALASANTQQPNSRSRELEEQLAGLESQIENATLVAPFSGTLTRIDAWQGQVTGPGNSLAEVVSDAAPVVEVSIAAKTAQAQFVGRRLEVVMEGDIAVAAAIKSVAPLVDRSTRTRKVLLEITSDLSAVEYSLGSIVKVSFDSFRQADGFWLPLSALQKRAGGLWSTMILETNNQRTIAALRTIEVIYAENDTAYVRGALEDGDLVIFDGTHRIVPGQNVTVAAGASDVLSTTEEPSP